MVNRPLADVRRELKRVVHHLVEAASDAAILLSMPGIGGGELAALLAEGSAAVRRWDYAARAVVRRRLAAHGRLRETPPCGLVWPLNGSWSANADIRLRRPGSSAPYVPGVIYDPGGLSDPDRNTPKIEIRRISDLQTLGSHEP